MKLESKHTFAYPRHRVWDVLLDPNVLARCMPGCEKFEQVGGDKYAVTMKLGIASVKGTYNGTVEVVEKRPPTNYKLRGEGKGAPGWARGEAAFELAERDGQTDVTARADISVGGTIAGVGQRMLDGVSKVMVQQFFESLEKELAGQKIEKTSLFGFIWGFLRSWLRLGVERLRGRPKS